MNRLPHLDWDRAADWLWALIGPLLAVGAVALLWAMSSAPDALTRVPDLGGLRSNVAAALAGEQGLRTKDVRVVHGGIAGTVVDQTPKAGAFLRRGEVVTVGITVGAKQVAVPDVSSMPLDQAREVLSRRGLGIGAVVYRDYPGREPGRVIATTPVPGTRVDQGTRVEIEVPLPPHS